MLLVTALLLSAPADARDDAGRTGLGAYVEVANGWIDTSSSAGWNLELRTGRVAVSFGMGWRYVYRREERNLYVFHDWARAYRGQVHLLGSGVDTWEIALGAGPLYDEFTGVGWGLGGGSHRSIVPSLYAGYRWEEASRPHLLVRVGLGLAYNVLGVNLSVGWQGLTLRRTR